MTIAGGRRPQVTVEIDPARLSSYGIDPLGVQRAILSANSRQRAGEIVTGGRSEIVEAGAWIDSVARLESVVVDARGGRSVWLRDVATVRDEDGEPTSYVAHHTPGGRTFPAVTVSIAKRKGVNAIDLTRRIKFKNRVTHELEAACIKLSSVIADVFGKSGRHIVDGLLNGMDLEKILESIPSGRVRKNKEEIRGIIQANLSSSQIFLLRSHLNMIDAVTKQIEEIDAKISDLISLRNEDMRIALSMPGMGFISASTILAEIGDFRDFSSANKLAAYCGLVPSVYQSAGKLINGHITKHGSPHISQYPLNSTGFSRNRPR